MFGVRKIYGKENSSSLDAIFMRLYFAFLLMAVSFLTGCEPKNHTDVTDQGSYSLAVGYKFESQVELLALGITLDQNYKGEADYVLLMSRPGVSGPEVAFRKVIPAKSQFRVVGVLKSGRIFSARTMYQVEFLDSQHIGDAPVVVDVVEEINLINKGLKEEEFVYLGK